MSALMIIFCILNVLLIFGALVFIFHDFNLVASSIALPVNLVAGIVEALTVTDVKYIIWGLGAALLIVIIIGAFGLIKDSSCLLVIYGVSMGLLAVVNLGVGAYLLTQTDAIKRSVDTFMDNSFLDPNMTVFHQIESRFKCCGTYGPDFYMTYEGEDYVAPSCCEGGTHCTKNTAFQRGCSFVVRDGLEKESTNWGYILVAFAAVQFAAAGIGLYYAGFTKRGAFWWRYL